MTPAPDDQGRRRGDDRVLGAASLGTRIFHEFNAQANEFNLALPMVHEFNFNAGEFILQVSFLHREISPNAYDKKEPIKFSRSDPKILVRTGAQK